MADASIPTKTIELPDSVLFVINYVFRELYEATPRGGFKIKEEEVRAIAKALGKNDAQIENYVNLCRVALQEWVDCNNEQADPIPVPIP